MSGVILAPGVLRVLSSSVMVPESGEFSHAEHTGAICAAALLALGHAAQRGCRLARPPGADRRPAAASDAAPCARLAERPAH